MRFTALVATLIGSLVIPSVASAHEVTSARAAHDGALTRSGVIAIQHLSLEQDRVAAAQMQQTKLKRDKKTTIIVVSVVAAAAVIYLLYQLNHSGPFISGHF